MAEIHCFPISLSQVAEPDYVCAGGSVEAK
jgi:hypothetical protein